MDSQTFRGSLGLLRLSSAAAGFLASLSIAIPAFAAPSVDTTVPTANWSFPCAAGFSSNTVCRTDNSTVSYYMDSAGKYELESADRTEVNATIARYDATDLSIGYDSSPVFSGSGETDIVYQEGSDGLPDSVWGATWCDDPIDGSALRCDQSIVRIRGGGVITEVVAGHETGHSFGLVHGAQAAPAQDRCDNTMGIMRSSTSCLFNPALGSTIVANLNWVY